VSREAGPLLREGEARSIVLRCCEPLGAELVTLETASGTVLAEKVASDIDMPPFNRTAMDGYALRLADIDTLPAELTVIEQVQAGDVPRQTIGSGQCTEVMTGAPVPDGADAVVRVEDTEQTTRDRVRILRSPGNKTNIAYRGEDLRRGDVVLEPGCLLGPAQTGLLAMVGRRQVIVHRPPVVDILATGNELVEPDQTPRPGQTRNCNNYSLLSQCARVGVRAESLGLARDTRGEIEAKVRAGLEHDVLLVSGGVSVGRYDLVPQVFAALGVEVHFDKVAIKPGKPTVFATCGKTLVFGLPGNPVATMVAFRLLVEPALKRLAGRRDFEPVTTPALLSAPVRNRRDRRAYLPARLSRTGGGLSAEPIGSHGSADMLALSKADALIRLEPAVGECPAGAEVQVLLLGS